MSTTHAENGAPLIISQTRSLKEMVDLGFAHVPNCYIRPPHDRPCLRPSLLRDQLQVPVVRLDQACRSDVVKEVGAACSEWGVFQVIDHGVSPALQSQLWGAADHFFSLPTKTKLDLVSRDPASPLLFFSGFHPHEMGKEWKDTLGFKPNPSMNHRLLPHFLEKPMLSFHAEIRLLACKVWEAILASLGLDFSPHRGYLSRETLTFNYYPTCPQPELTLGMSSHSDFGSITIIMQDEVEGLHVRRKDDWVIVKTIPNSFIVLLGDQMEILTNGYYKSVEHRVLTNQAKPRMSVTCFFAPSEDEIIKPLDQFICINNPRLYKETIFKDYLKNAFGKPLTNKSNLEFSSYKDL